MSGKEWNDHGFVLFAGAGCSMAPPSSLPDWKQLNDAILEVLWDRLEPYGLRDKYREQILASVRQRRDENRFPPDYQAQLMEERVGIRYFELLSAVDSGTYNAVQYYAAHMARLGLVKAVITTNFDRNFERAFMEQGVDFISYADEKDFSSLSGGAIPLLKIHGCCSRPDSMVDTGKQRLQGRSKALEQAISSLLEQYPFLVCGFSGADFDENPDYLGFRSAAPRAAGLTYLCMPGKTVRDSMQQLLDHYGREKATVIEADPALFLEEQLRMITGKPLPFVPGSAISTFREQLVNKAAAIEPLDCFNMLVALVESYGDEISARYLYDKIWRNRFVTDYEGDAISRFLLNHGRSYVFNYQDKKERAAAAGVLIEQAFMGEVPPGQEEVFTNPAMLNLRHQKNTSPETPALVGLVQTYNSKPVLFRDFPGCLQREISESTPETRADIFYYYAVYAFYFNHFYEGITVLEIAIRDMEQASDLPRLSRLLSRYSMFLCRIEEVDAARSHAMKAEILAMKFHEPEKIAQASLAMAMVKRKSGDFTEALQHIHKAITLFKDLYRLPQYFEAVLEYLKILFLALEKDSRQAEYYFSLLNPLINNVEQHLVGRIPLFEPEYCYLTGMILHHFGTAGESMEWFVDAVSLSEQFGQEANLAYYRETCRQLDILEMIEQNIQLQKP